VNEYIVSDSACLIALERIGMLGLLSEVFSKVLIPPAVQTECGIVQPWLQIEAPSHDTLIRALRLQVHQGESEAIVLASERSVACILDDQKARRVARDVGVRVIGTVGVILRAKRHGAIEAVKPILTALVTHGFHLGPGLIDEALRQAGEQQA